MAFGIGNVGGSGGSLDVDFGTGRDGELFIDVNQTITLLVTAETGSIDKHYTSGYIDVNGILRPQTRHRYATLRFTGDLTLRGTIDWTGSGAMHDSRYGEMPYLFTAGEYDVQDRPKFVLPVLNLYGNAPVFGGNGGAGGRGAVGRYTSGGLGSLGSVGHVLAGGAGGNGGGGDWDYSTTNITGQSGVAPSLDYSGSPSYGYAGYGASGGVGGGPGAGGGNQDNAARTGTAYPGGLLILLVAGDVQLTASGKINNTGMAGAGGCAASTYGKLGGAGGGGGGGIIMLLHGGNLSNLGTISVSGGVAGVGGNGGGAAGTTGSILTKKV